MAAHQAPLSLGFSRQEHWSGLPFPSPMRESEATQSWTPMDRRLPGSSVHGLFQAKVLEWVAIAFSGLGMRYLNYVPVFGTFLGSLFFRQISGRQLEQAEEPMQQDNWRENEGKRTQ